MTNEKQSTNYPRRTGQAELSTNYTKKHNDFFPQRRKGAKKKLYLKTLRLSALARDIKLTIIAAPLRETNLNSTQT
jgi:hypothetical protein